VKSEFRRLNLGSTFTPVESEPRGRIMLSRASRLERAGLSFVRAVGRAITSVRHSGAVQHLTREPSGPLTGLTPSRSFRSPLDRVTIWVEIFDQVVRLRFHRRAAIPMSPVLKRTTVAGSGTAGVSAAKV
jgi:hypothetical protein